MYYVFENVLNKSTVRPQMAIAGVVNGSAVDTRGYGDGMVIVEVGATTGTPSSFSVAAKVQESADGSTGWVDISGAAITAVTIANKSAEIKLQIGKRAASLRYVRTVITPAFVAGSTPTIGIASSVLLGNPEVAPVVNSTVAN